MPLMYMENSLQMEWCLNCHRNPAKNLRPTSEIYNMAWEGASELKPVWCAAEEGPAGSPTAGGVTCTKRIRGEWWGAGCSIESTAHGTHLQTATAIGREDTTPMKLPAGIALPEVHEPEGPGQVPGRAVPHPHIRRADQLRDMPPMNRDERISDRNAAALQRAKPAAIARHTSWCRSRPRS